jgi:HEPN domain-containing protein
VNATEQAQFRLRLAEGFLQEARQDIEVRRWRSCVDNSQLAAEHAAKTVLGLLGPIGRTHKPFVFLRQALREGRFAESLRERIERMAECAELLGPDVHVKSDYGDEDSLKVPWELFGESDARQALELAEEAVRLARETVKGGSAP